MKHAVIVAHPNPDSLTCAVARTYAAAVRAAGDTTLMRDLYRMGFDPCLKLAEVPGVEGVTFAPDVLAERTQLADVDVFAFIYPLWFNAPPAILKGYVDRVFSMGFGYTPGFGGTEPGLSGKQLISFTTSGAPDQWIRDTGGLAALQALFDAHLAGVCGVSLVDHVHNGGIVPGITAEAVEQVRETVRAAVRRHFAPVSDTAHLRKTP